MEQKERDIARERELEIAFKIEIWSLYRSVPEGILVILDMWHLLAGLPLLRLFD